MSDVEKVNYHIRPAKYIERKMMCESFAELVNFYPISDYQYIGFGSYFFQDFKLIHKTLGICDMTSMEREENNRKRFEFNRPFSCVKIIFGESSKIIPSLNWQKPAIVWLDYDGSISEQVFSDVKWIVSNCVSGSMIIVTVNVQPSSIAHAMEDFEEAVGRKRIPNGLKNRDLMKLGTSKIVRNLINDEIRKAISDRSAGLSNERKYRYTQLFNFIYRDGALMSSYGGVVSKASDINKLIKCGFNKYNYICNGEEYYYIDAPKMTMKEIEYLNSYLPKGEDDIPDDIELDQELLQRYSRVYKYFPSYSSIEG